MPKELLLYGPTNEDTARAFVEAVIAADIEQAGDLLVRINTDGGNPNDMQSMAARLSEYSGQVNAQVDGKAYSSGTFILPYINGTVTAYDISQFLIHRAAYSSWFEKSEYMTEALWDNLNAINSGLRKALEARIDVKKLKELKGVTLNQIFDNATRIDVFLTADEAKQIGLVDKVVKLTPKKRAEIEQKITASMLPTAWHQGNAEFSADINPKTKMTLDELKSQHPDVYAQAVNAGVSQERDRVGAWMAFVDVDADQVAAGIKNGESISQTATAELARKAFSKQSLEALKKEAAPAVETKETEAALTEAQKKEAELNAFLDSARKLRAKHKLA